MTSLHDRHRDCGRAWQIFGGSLSTGERRPHSRQCALPLRLGHGLRDPRICSPQSAGTYLLFAAKPRSLLSPNGFSSLGKHLSHLTTKP